MFFQRQYEVLELWRNGLTIENISKELHVKENTVSITLDRAIDSIIKQYEKDI